MKIFFFLLLICCLPVVAQTPTKSDPFQSLAFLEGTWDAKIENNPDVKESGRYKFQRELDGNVLARHSTTNPNCTAPTSLDCAHSDLLYVFRDGPDSSLKAIYFDNEAHVIHYDVTTPSPNSVIFLSTPGQGPRLRLTYELSSGVMKGKFQMLMPGQSEWRSYLEWSGSRKVGPDVRW
jgi:hypothetical protein